MAFSPNPSNKAPSDVLRYWRIVAAIVRCKVYFGPLHSFPEFGEVTEVKTGSPDESVGDTLSRWFVHSIDNLKLVIRARSRRLTVSFEDLIVSRNCGFEATGLSKISAGERYLANYLRSCDPLIFEGKHVCELGSGV